MESVPTGQKILIQIMILLALTLINAFFAGAEMAVVSVNKNKIKRIAKAGNKKAQMLLKVSEDSTGFLSTIQVAITFAGFFSSASAATGVSEILAEAMKSYGIPYSGTIAFVGVTILLSFFTLVFGELVPKRIAMQKAESFSLLVVKPICLVSKIMKPFVLLLTVATNRFLSLIRMNNSDINEEVSEEEIKTMLEIGQSTGVFNDIEKEMITSVFAFDDKKAKEVMTKRQDMIAVDQNKMLNEWVDDILWSKHSNIPVYNGDLDSIVGIISMKDYMIKAKKKNSYYIPIAEVMKAPYFVSENRKINSVFFEMKKKNIRLAIVLDEYGGVSGLLTMEDLVEAIVGSMNESHRSSETEWIQVEENVYIVYGKMLLDDINEKLQVSLQAKSVTLSGYLIEQLGYIPNEASMPIEITKNQVKFTILSVEKNVIKKVRIQHNFIKPMERIG